MKRFLSLFFALLMITAVRVDAFAPCDLEVLNNLDVTAYCKTINLDEMKDELTVMVQDFIVVSKACDAGDFSFFTDNGFDIVFACGDWLAGFCFVAEHIAHTQDKLVDETYFENLATQVIAMNRHKLACDEAALEETKILLRDAVEEAFDDAKTSDSAELHSTLVQLHNYFMNVKMKLAAMKDEIAQDKEEA